MPPVNVFKQDTATNTDAWSAQDLSSAPGHGVVSVWAASTVNTGTLSVSSGRGEMTLRAQTIPLRTNGIPNLSDDVPLAVFEVMGGEKIVVNIGGTPGTVHSVGTWIPWEEL